MTIHKSYFWISLAIALAICVAQILGSTILILVCLAVYLCFAGWACSRDFTLPILLFFLPWSQIQKVSPGAFSFYTFSLVLVCGISLVKNRFWFRRYHLAAGIVLLALTLLSKLLDGNFLAFDYVAFMMLLFLFPVVKAEWTRKKYDFFETVFFFGIGVVAAALCAKQFSVYPNIARYINIHSYLNIIRLSGFYGDPNFYTAQILAAMGGTLVAVLQEPNRRRVTAAAVLTVVLVYCGFLSGSKSFALIAVAMIVMWFVQLVRMRGRAGRKFLTITLSVLVLIFIATSALFSGLIEIVLTRFSFSKDFASFTTGRTELWARYLEEIFSSGKILFLGKGFTNVKVDDRAPHNTVIQAVFQLGIIGVPVLIYWFVGFFEELRGADIPLQRRFLTSMLLISGVYVPWMALDILFFDEFFLLQWFVFVGLKQLGEGYGANSRLPSEEIRERKKVPRKRTRLVWR